MKKRVITGAVIGIIYIATVLLCIYVNKIFFDVFMLLIALGAGLEMSKALSVKFGKPIDIFIVLTTVLGYLGFYLVQNRIGSQSGGITAYFGVLAVMFLACVIFTMCSKRHTMRNAVSTMIALVYPVSILIYMLGLNYLQESYRVAAILLLFLVSTFTDTFAYIVGSTIKGPKLCPNISPNKTISGAVGGLLGGMLGAALVMVLSIFGWLHVSPLSGVMSLNIVHFLVLGLGGSVFTQVGDLIASFLKRSCSVKDFGSILPGHGGILDRIDGMMVNAVFLFIYMIILMW